MFIGPRVLLLQVLQCIDAREAGGAPTSPGRTIEVTPAAWLDPVLSKALVALFHGGGSYPGWS